MRNCYILRMLALFLFMGLFFELGNAALASEIFYVAPSGKDTNPGTFEKPWKTIQHAADTLQAGQTVFIREGIYHEAVVTSNGGNTNDGYIVFSAYQKEKPVIDGAGVNDANNGFVINKSYIQLIGLEVCNWNEVGIWLENAGYTKISDCMVHDVTYGIGFSDGTHHFELNRVVAHHFDLFGFDASPSGGADCHHGIFNDCMAYSGRDPDQNVDGFALGHGTQHDFEFNHCEAYDVYDGFDISAQNTTLSRCLAHHCWNSGMKIWQDKVTIINCISYRNDSANVELDWDDKPGTVTLQNCTLMGAATFNIWINNSADSLHMYNTILAGGENIGLAFEQKSTANYRGDYNIFHNANPDRVIAVGYEDEFTLDQVRNGAWIRYSGQDRHSMVVASLSQLFVNTSKNDFHLKSNSSAIDQGNSKGTPFLDFDENPRLNGKGPDIGAYEFIMKE